MTHSITDTYKMKREILNFARIFSSGLSAPDAKFFADMTYGILASQSCLLTKIAHALQEKTKKAYTVDRLSNHLKDGINDKAMATYLNYVRKMVPSEPVVHIDDSDVIKPDGYHFEALGTVRDGSKSTTKKCVYAKGYYVTEACVLTDSNHPASIYSRIHSSHEKGFTSVNHITFEAIDRSVKLLKNATFVMDRGYDDNKIFQKLWGLEQDFVIRLTQKRKLFFHRKWVSATKLCAERKGKVKMNLFYKGKAHEAYISHVKVQLTAAKKDVYLVLVYGITEHPMMLVTNKMIRSKDDVIKVARLYFSRWRIEEYFRAKKQVLDFENFRVRSLISINALNFHITIAMTFLSKMTRKAAANALLKSVLDAARSIKDTVHFLYYRISYGIAEILKYARVGIRDWFKPKRTDQNQLRFRLSA